MKGDVSAERIPSSCFALDLGGCSSFCRELTCSLSHRWSQPFDIKSKDSLQEEKRESLTHLHSVLFGAEVVDIVFEVISIVKLCV